MTLSQIIAELENCELEAEEIKTSAENVFAAVSYFFEQLRDRETWTQEELDELKISSQTDKALTMLEEALRKARTGQ